jgi:quinol monooxygenase YgiN
VAKPDKIAETRQLLLGLVEPTRKEAGCISYVLLQNDKDPADFTFVEEWASAEALAAHMQMPYLQAALPRAMELSASPPDIRTYTVAE